MTSSSMIEYSPTNTPGPILAEGATRAVAAIVAEGWTDNILAGNALGEAKGHSVGANVDLHIRDLRLSSQ